MIGRSIGKYRILERIGRGGMGTVYRAIDESLQREVAIKVLNAEVTEPEALRRFRAEAITLARLQHPAIATLFELTEDDGDLLMVMEFVRGETLQKLAERMGKVPPDFAAQLCSQALDGLWHAHRAGIVHRDLKPGNLMVTGDGIVKVMDFGIARIAGSEHLTSDGFTMGTPAYMAPEQVRGDEVDARSDIYSMGVVLYRLWTGQLPFNGETAFAIAHRQLNEQPVPLKVAGPELPSWCDMVLSRALAKSPSERYQTALEFKNALSTAATFMSLDDVATVTLRTPRAVMLPQTSMTSMPASGTNESARVISRSTAVQAQPPETPAAPSPPASGATERPATGPAPVTGRTVVISPRQVFAGVTSLMVVLVVVAIGTVLAIKRIQQSKVLPSQPVALAPAPTVAVQPVPVPAEPPPPAAAGATPPPTASIPNAAPVPPPAPVAPNKAASAASAKTPAQNPPGTTAANATSKAPASGATAPPASPQPEAPAAPSSGASVIDTQPAVAFDKVKLLVVDGDKAREDDAELRFANGNVQILGASQRVVGSFPYQSVHTVTSTRSKQPRWKGPDGTVVDAKMSGGAFGFLKSDKNWVALVTSKATYVFRVEDGDLQTLTHTAVERTGAQLVRLAGK